MRGFRPILAVSVLAVAGAAAPEHPSDSVEPVMRQYLDHAGFKWKSKQTKHFRLYFEDGLEAGKRPGALRRAAMFLFRGKKAAEPDALKHSDALEKNVEEDRDRVLGLIGETAYEPTISAFLLTSGAQMKRLVGVEVDGRSRPGQHAVFSVVTPDRLHLTHELCHEIASNLWGAAEPWIEEGLATYADEGANIYFDSWRLFDSGSLLPLDKLVDPEWKSSMYSPDITYTELGGFLKFLRDRYGVAKVKQVWQGGSQAIPRVFGESLADLEKDWHAALVGQFPVRPTRHYRSAVSGLGIQ